MLDYRYNTFLKLVETKSYTNTANLLNFTQPAVTKHIQSIEKELHTTLVFYKNKQLNFTEEGLYLYREIKKINEHISEIESNLFRNISLKIGTSKTIGEFLIQDKISEFTSLFNNIEISILVENTRILLKMLDERKINFALISGPIEDKKYDSSIFFKDDILLICSNQHKFANKSINIEKLSDEKFLLREMGSGLMESVDDKIMNKNFFIAQKNKQTVGNINMIKKMVKKNEGISFIYKTSAIEDINNNQYTTITLKDFNQVQPFYIVKNNKQILTDYSEYFIKTLKNL